MGNENNDATQAERVPPVVMYECKCPMVPAQEGDRDLGDEIGEILGANPDAAVFIAFRTPGITTKKEARDWIKSRGTVKTGDSYHVLKPLDSIDVGELRPVIKSRGSEDKPKRDRKPKVDENGNPIPRGKPGRKPKAQPQPQAPAQSVNPMPQPQAPAQSVNPMPQPQAPAQAPTSSGKPKPVIGGKRR